MLNLNCDFIITPHPCSSLYKYNHENIIDKEPITLSCFYDKWKQKKLSEGFVKASVVDCCDNDNNDDEDDNGDIPPSNIVVPV